MPLEYYDSPNLSEAEHAELDHSGIPGVGEGGGGAVEGLGDQIYFRRDFPLDETTTAFTYEDDVFGTPVGTSIVVDESVGFVGTYGYPAPKLDAGLYSVFFNYDSTDIGPGHIYLSFLQAGEEADAPSAPLGFIKQPITTVAGIGGATLTFTWRSLEDGGHIDSGVIATPGDGTATLIITKVG